MDALAAHTLGITALLLVRGLSECGNLTLFQSVFAEPGYETGLSRRGLKEKRRKAL
jgi:hypothetical protein